MTRRVGYLLKKFPRLSETFVLNEILRQEQLGQEVHVFSRRETDDEPTHEQLGALRARVETLPSTHVMNPWRELFVEDSRRVSIESLARLVRGMEPLAHPRVARLVAEALYVRRRVDELGIDHLHVHFATDSAVVAMMVRELGGPGYSITAHAKDIYRETVDPAVLGRVMAASEFTVTVCDANVRHLERMLPPAAAAKVRRLYNGVDLDAFRPGAATREEGHVLAVGRLVPKKGFDILLRALALLRDDGVDCRATIVGDGLERAALEALARDLALGERVRFTGPLTQGEVRAYLDRATLFCLPCVIDPDGNRDALPTVLLEALACGLPAISTPVTGVPEIFAHGEAGRLVPESDIRATAGAMRHLLTSPDERAALAAAGRRHMERTFDARRVAEELHSWFQGPVPVS